ncbi:DUF2939 domain-containing protein [Hymenobacter sp. UYP22]|uniref:DUF2939 domain-containing protein n=1 Tax=Hymenobacter sp. UYP22 TaxID=3156348 RepID=UPI0033977D58
MKKILGLLAGMMLVLFTVAWATSRPERTMHNITAALDAGDHQALQQWVDLPAVQASLAGQYAQFLAFKMRNSPDWRAIEATGTDERLARELMAEVVTPEGLLRLLRGDHQLVVGRLNADNVMEATLATPLANRTEQQPEKASPFRYAVLFTDTASRQPMMRLTLTFNGVAWRLTGVQIPMWGKLYTE